MSIETQPSLPPALSGLGVGEVSALLASHTARPLWGPWHLVGAARNDLGSRLEVLAAWAGAALPRGGVLCGHTAAWAWLGGEAPRPATARVAKLHRAGPVVEPPLKLREGLPPAHLVATLPGLRLTTPLGTAAELLLERGGPPAQNATTVRALLQLEGAWGETPPPAALRGRRRAQVDDLKVAWEGLVQAFR